MLKRIFGISPFVAITAADIIASTTIPINGSKDIHSSFQLIRNINFSLFGSSCLQKIDCHQLYFECHFQGVHCHDYAQFAASTLTDVTLNLKLNFTAYVIYILSIVATTFGSSIYSAVVRIRKIRYIVIRKSLKTLVIVGIIVGLLYQSIDLTINYVTLPTIQAVQIKPYDRSDLPFFTTCWPTLYQNRNYYEKFIGDYVIADEVMFHLGDKDCRRIKVVPTSVDLNNIHTSEIYTYLQGWPAFALYFAHQSEYFVNSDQTINVYAESRELSLTYRDVHTMKRSTNCLNYRKETRFKSSLDCYMECSKREAHRLAGILPQDVPLSVNKNQIVFTHGVYQSNNRCRAACLRQDCSFRRYHINSRSSGDYHMIQLDLMYSTFVTN